VIYLASRSPRRRELLHQLHVTHQVLMMREDPRRGMDVDETPLAGEAPRGYALRVARAKARAGGHVLAQRAAAMQWPVLAADTTVTLADAIIGKPCDAAHAAEILADLAGREHRVITAVALARGERLLDAVSESSVTFAALTPGQIKRYIATGEPMDKAGAYAVQGRAAAFITRIDGSYSGIMGLPLCETAQLLAAFGIDFA
jgi:septum formation protein